MNKVSSVPINMSWRCVLGKSITSSGASNVFTLSSSGVLPSPIQLLRNCPDQAIASFVKAMLGVTHSRLSSAIVLATTSLAVSSGSCRACLVSDSTVSSGLGSSVLRNPCIAGVKKVHLHRPSLALSQASEQVVSTPQGSDRFGEHFVVAFH